MVSGVALFNDMGIPLRWMVADAPAAISPMLVSAHTRPPASRSTQLCMETGVAASFRSVTVSAIRSASKV